MSTSILQQVFIGSHSFLSDSASLPVFLWRVLLLGQGTQGRPASFGRSPRPALGSPETLPTSGSGSVTSADPHTTHCTSLGGGARRGGRCSNPGERFHDTPKLAEDGTCLPVTGPPEGAMGLRVKTWSSVDRGGLPLILGSLFHLSGVGQVATSF